ncbi:hypothetical protein AB0B94_31175 [Micromonospora sp. NPDC048986]|uniref:hypothetical protein n=1 Tax=Micromonospora sp. NPDC048986 TaxID=3155644 RepID=UPI00340C19A1
MKEPWFGMLLDWQWDPQTERHTTWHNGRAHHIVKVDRSTADANGGGMQPGWQIWDDNPNRDENRWNGFGPGLGRTVGWAKRCAEAWIICPYNDMMQYPQLSHAIRGGSAHYEGLSIRTEDELRRFAAYDRDRLAGLILPVFLGSGGTTSIRWRAHHPDGRLISGGDSWSDAVTDLRAAVVGAVL